MDVNDYRMYSLSLYFATNIEGMKEWCCLRIYALKYSILPFKKHSAQHLAIMMPQNHFPRSKAVTLASTSLYVLG